MRLVSSSILMIAGACLALGLMHLRFWLSERERRDYLAFTVVCFAVAVYAGFELALMNAVTPDEYNGLARWGQLPGSIVLIAVGWFTYVNLGGRRWLFWTIVALRVSALILNFALTPNINFRHISSIEKVTLFGEPLSYPVGVPNPWMILAQATFFLLIIFCLDSSFRAWRRGDRRNAVVFGSSILFFTVTSSVMAIGVLWNLVDLPLMASVSVMFLVAGMFYQLSYDMHRMAKLSGDLIERESELSETLKQLTLSTGAANVGVWTRRSGGDVIYVNDILRGLFALSSVDPISQAAFIEKVHPADRERLLSAIDQAESTGSDFHIEFRILLEDGQMRWIESRGTAEQSNGHVSLLRGASIDITRRKSAENAIHDLSRKLINAQERERARLARELHDDLSQRLALLSIRLGELHERSGDPTFVKSQVDHLSSEIGELSIDIHRISHELHPAKLTQLGLVSALRGFCREVAAAHPIKINFDAENFPRTIPDDVSLCLYRITQEAVQNVVKHSGAESVGVDVKLEDGVISLTITDNGCGMNIDAVKTKESLGLISINERTRAINGTVKIDSAVGVGTEIEVRVPVSWETREA